jgi:cell division protease FtsH
MNMKPFENRPARSPHALRDRQRMRLPEADRHTHSKPFIEAQIAILMSGRVAEELSLRQMTSGASNDIERATALARQMVCEFGMSSLGPVLYRRPASAWDTEVHTAGFSEETTRRVDDEIRGLVQGHETSRRIVEQQREAVRALAMELLDVESVDADRVRQMLAQHEVPAPSPSAAAVPDPGVSPPGRLPGSDPRRSSASAGGCIASIPPG